VPVPTALEAPIARYGRGVTPGTTGRLSRPEFRRSALDEGRQGPRVSRVLELTAWARASPSSAWSMDTACAEGNRADQTGRYAVAPQTGRTQESTRRCHCGVRPPPMPRAAATTVYIE
jgi:hypothetical protein